MQDQAVPSSISLMLSLRPPAPSPLCLAWPEAFVQGCISLLISFQYVSFVSCPCVGIWTETLQKPFAHFKRPTHPSPIPLFPVSEVISQVLLHSSFLYLVFSSESCYRAQAGLHLQRAEVAYVRATITRVSIFACFFEIGPPVAPASFELLILLSFPPECWDYKPSSLCTTSLTFSETFV